MAVLGPIPGSSNQQELVWLLCVDGMCCVVPGGPSTPVFHLTRYSLTLSFCCPPDLWGHVTWTQRQSLQGKAQSHCCCPQVRLWKAFAGSHRHHLWGMNCILQYPYVKIITPNTTECDLTWKSSIVDVNLIEVRSGSLSRSGRSLI